MDNNSLEITKLLRNNDFCQIFSNLDFADVTFYPFFVVKFDYKKDFLITFCSHKINCIGYNYEEVTENQMHLSEILLPSEYEFYKNTFEKKLKKETKFFDCHLKIADKNKDVFQTMTHTVLHQTERGVCAELYFLDVYSLKSECANAKKITSYINTQEMFYSNLSYTKETGFNLFELFSVPDEFNLDIKKIKESKQFIFSLLSDFDKNIIKKQSISKINKNKLDFCNIFKLDQDDDVNCYALFDVSINIVSDNLYYIDLMIYNFSNQHKFLDIINSNRKNIEINFKHSQIISSILKDLHNTSDYIQAIQDTLQKVADYVHGSKVIVVLPHKLKESNRVLLYDRKTKTKSDYILAMNEMKRKYPKMLKRLKKYGTAYRDGFGGSSDCEDEFLKIGDYSFIIYSIVCTPGNIGYVAICDEDNNRKWDKKIISLISDLSQIMGNTFQKLTAQQELSTTLNTFKTVIDNMDSLVCVCTVEDDTIIFSNRKFEENFNTNTLNKYLWQVLEYDKFNYYNQIYTEFLNPEDNQHTYVEIFCDFTKQWLSVTQTGIIWVDGTLVKLFTISNITEKVEYEKLIENQVLMDYLTNLPNRRMLEKDFTQLVDAALQNSGHGYMLFLDLDNFKNVNDELGHHYGDILLQVISKFLKSLPYSGEYTYRFGGDEFVLLLPYEYCDKLEFITNILFSKFRERWSISDSSYFCTMSMGIAQFPVDGTNFNEILKKVDMAMYNAKNSGKNRCTHYEYQIGMNSIRSMELERYLRESIANGCQDFILYFQPIVNAQTQKIVGAEALLRWDNENLGMVSPVEFIELAERLGLMLELGELVMQKACKQCKRMIDLGHEDFSMSINISVAQLFEVDFVTVAQGIIHSSGAPYRNITFEVTESLAISDFNKVRGILDELTAMGVSVSLDDFGTGYSSLNNIKEIPLNTIKIDKSFIDDMENNSTTQIFINSIVSLAHALDIKICAEGVENRSQFDRLCELEADLIQGYYFGRPVPADQFEKMLQETTLVEQKDNKTRELF